MITLEQQKSDLTRILLESLAAMLLLAVFYYCLRLPHAHLRLSYYDDGETLYHTLSLLEGRVPYLQDWNHHFVGYVLPFVGLAKVLGFSLSLVSQVALLNQVLMAWGVFLCVRLFCPFSASLISALLAISAREPWIAGFFVQQQLNVLFAFALYACLKYLNRRERAWLYISALISGIAFSFDQRAILYSLLPGAAFLLTGPFGLRKILEWTCMLAAWALSPLLCLIWITQQHALPALIEQTWIFPRLYRAGGFSWSEVLWLGIYSQRYIITLSPLLFCGMLVGLFAVLKNLKAQNKNAAMILSSAIPLFIMPLFGSRDFDYYSLTWIPWLAIMAGFGISWSIAAKKSRLLKPGVLTLTLAPLLISSLGAVKLASTPEVYKYTGDGVKETADYLTAHSDPRDNIYLWGYRLELYARLKRLSEYPFGSQIFVLPDQGAVPELADRHVYPKYRDDFLDLLSTKPPRFIVRFSNSQFPPLYKSPVVDTLNSKIATEYSEVFKIQKPDFRGYISTFIVYKRHDNF